jgi:hypothetical protein
VDLEIRSTFAFQGSRWLGDTLDAVLTADRRAGLAGAKERAKRRVAAEKQIPGHLLYTRDWPTCVPTRAEAVLLGAVRAAVADAVGLAKTFTGPDEIIARYTELLAEKAERDKAAAEKAARKAARAEKKRRAA